MTDECLEAEGWQQLTGCTDMDRGLVVVCNDQSSHSNIEAALSNKGTCTPQRPVETYCYTYQSVLLTIEEAQGVEHAANKPANELG
jgi:hypothetical protein